MEIRPFQPEDAAGLARLAAGCARGEADFVLNPLWESEDELFAEFERHGIDPREHLLVGDLGGGEVGGLVGFLRRPGEPHAGLFCPVVSRELRGRGHGGRLLRAAFALGAGQLGITLATAAIGTRNRAGYSLLTAHGFRPEHQVFLLRCEDRPTVGIPPDGLGVQVAAEEDAEAILSIYDACGFDPRGIERMREVLSDGRHFHAVARTDADNGGDIVGFVELEVHWPRRVWVAFVGVDPGLRDRGVGTALVAWALERQFDSGTVAAQLMLSPANRTALRAYEKVGFRRFRLLDVMDRAL